MATLRTVTVKSAGGDYSNLNAAEAGEQADLVSLDRQLDIECYAMDDTSRAIFDGWTTDATRYIRVFAATGEGHEGVWSTSKYRIRSSTGFGSVITIVEDYARIEGLQVYQPSGAYASLIRLQPGATSDVRVDRCLLNGSGATHSLAGLYADSGVNTARNTVVYGMSGLGCASASGTLTIDNCTSIATTYGLSRIGGTVNARNVYCHGGTDAYTGTITRTTCAHSSATVFAGSTASVAHDTSNFTNVTGGSEDYTVVSGSALLDVGTDLSGTFTNSINNVTRPQNGAFDIGASELTVAAAKAYLHRRFSLRFVGK